MQMRPVPGAVPNREVDIVGREIGMPARGADPQINLGMRRGKIPEPGHQPLAGEVRGNRNRQNGFLLARRLGSGSQTLQRLPNMDEIGSAGVGQRQATVPAVEKPDTKQVFQFANLMADRPLG